MDLQNVFYVHRRCFGGLSQTLSRAKWTITVDRLSPITRDHSTLFSQLRLTLSGSSEATPPPVQLALTSCVGESTTSPPEQGQSWAVLNRCVRREESHDLIKT
ncbi:hypothetical protein INR49_031579 [Caranx melampygus]|nr:hypothetical protein INR49_031579 [Caranx melampygus]